MQMNITKVIIAGMMFYVLRTFIICAAITEILDKNKIKINGGKELNMREV